jgi:methionyl aminopeptidase
MRVTEAALYAGIEKARQGLDVYEIGAAVQTRVETEGFNVVRRFVGHGIGRAMHEKPEVPNFRPAMRGMPLKAGMVVAIEPMVTEGTYEVDVLEDRWTAVTRDRKLAAHFEHSVLVTAGGPEILSVSDRGLVRFFC